MCEIENQIQRTHALPRPAARLQYSNETQQRWSDKQERFLQKRCVQDGRVRSCAASAAVKKLECEKKAAMQKKQP
jgi:hypothetical protein